MSNKDIRTILFILGAGLLFISVLLWLSQPAESSTFKSPPADTGLVLYPVDMPNAEQESIRAMLEYLDGMQRRSERTLSYYARRLEREYRIDRLETKIDSLEARIRRLENPDSPTPNSSMRLYFPAIHCPICSKSGMNNVADNTGIDSEGKIYTCPLGHTFHVERK